MSLNNRVKKLNLIETGPMNISRFNLAVIFSLVTMALLSLMYIQTTLLAKDIEANKQQVELAFPAILLEIQDILSWDKQFRRELRDFEGTNDFALTKSSEPTKTLEYRLKKTVDDALSLNYPGVDYELNAFVSNEYSCLFHSHHHVGLAKASKVMKAETHMCLCSLGPTTFDISLSYPNKDRVVLGESWPSLLVSFILTVFILIAFGFVIVIFNKQKKLSEMKRDFVNNLTHEFKTPLFSISLASKALMKDDNIKMSDSLTKYVGVIENEGNRLKNQVDKILQTALIDSGNLTLDKKQVDLHQTIMKVADNFKMIIQDRNGILKMDLKSKNHFVFVDETHIKNIIYNLLDNAQKYSEKAPCITVRTEDSNSNIILSVADTGIGMDEEAQKYIFEQFYRARAKDVNEIKGFGLGLSYVRSIVDAHEGRIELESSVSKGSKFIIHLPIA